MREQDGDNGTAALAAACAIAAKLESGFVVAPLEPSREMVEEGVAAGGVTPACAKRIYQAMLGRL